MHEKKRLKIKVKLVVILADSIKDLAREIYRLQNLLEIEKNNKE